MDRTGKQYLYDDGMDDGGVDLLIVDLIPLFIALCNPSCFVLDWLFLRVFLDLIDLFTLENLSHIWFRNQIPGLILHQTVVFFFYNLLSECGICRTHSPLIDCGLSVYLFRDYIMIFCHEHEASSL